MLGKGNSAIMSMTEKKLNNYLQQAQFLMSSGSPAQASDHRKKKSANYSIDN